MSNPAAITRILLRQLATPPTGPDTRKHLQGVAGLIEDIRQTLDTDDQAGTPSIATSTLHDWRTRLDQLLRDFEATDPAAWTQARQPGTWLDSHLRLRSLLAHEVAKAFWDHKTSIDYASIDIERYLWGAR